MSSKMRKSTDKPYAALKMDKHYRPYQIREMFEDYIEKKQDELHKRDVRTRASLTQRFLTYILLQKKREAFNLLTRFARSDARREANVMRTKGLKLRSAKHFRRTIERIQKRTAFVNIHTKACDVFEERRQKKKYSRIAKVALKLMKLADVRACYHKWRVLADVEKGKEYPFTAEINASISALEIEKAQLKKKIEEREKYLQDLRESNDQKKRQKAKYWWEDLFEHMYDHFYDEIDLENTEPQYRELFRQIKEKKLMPYVLKLQRYTRRKQTKRWLHDNTKYDNGEALGKYKVDVSFLKQNEEKCVIF